MMIYMCYSFWNISLYPPLWIMAFGVYITRDINIDADLTVPNTSVSLISNELLFCRRWNHQNEQAERGRHQGKSGKNFFAHYIYYCRRGGRSVASVWEINRRYWTEELIQQRNKLQWSILIFYTVIYTLFLFIIFIVVCFVSKNWTKRGKRSWNEPSRFACSAKRCSPKWESPWKRMASLWASSLRKRRRIW